MINTEQQENRSPLYAAYDRPCPANVSPRRRNGGTPVLSLRSLDGRRGFCIPCGDVYAPDREDERKEEEGGRARWGGIERDR